MKKVSSLEVLLENNVRYGAESGIIIIQFPIVLINMRYDAYIN